MAKNKLSRGELLLHNVFTVHSYFQKYLSREIVKFWSFYKFINQLNFVTSHPGLHSRLHKSIMKVFIEVQPF